MGQAFWFRYLPEALLAALIVWRVDRSGLRKAREAKAAEARLRAAARWSEAEVIAIVLAETDDVFLRPPLFAHPALRDGRIVWTVYALVIGASTTAEVDDDTGQVIAIHQHPGR